MIEFKYPNFYKVPPCDGKWYLVWFEDGYYPDQHPAMVARFDEASSLFYNDAGGSVGYGQEDVLAFAEIPQTRKEFDKLHGC